GIATDVYALGAILYELLTGRPPFKAATSLNTIFQAMFDEPVPPARWNPQLPSDLETICLKCLRKEPERRYADAAALADDVRRFQAGKPILARRISVFERTAKWARRRPAAAALLATIMLAGIVLAGAGLWFLAKLRTAHDHAQRQQMAADQQRDRA